MSVNLNSSAQSQVALPDTTLLGANVDIWARILTQLPTLTTHGISQIIFKFSRVCKSAYLLCKAPVIANIAEEAKKAIRVQAEERLALQNSYFDFPGSGPSFY